MRRKSTKIIPQSGVIPYRVRNRKFEVLLVKNRSGQHWVIPKGGIPQGMTAPDSAAKEAKEEAGVIGQVNTNKFGIYKYHKRGNTYQVEVFLLLVEKVLSDWPEASCRKRQWLDVTKAAKYAEPAELKRILKTMTKHVGIQVGNVQTKQIEVQPVTLKRSYAPTLLQAFILALIVFCAGITLNLGTPTLTLLSCTIFLHGVWRLSKVWQSNHR